MFTKHTTDGDGQNCRTSWLLLACFILNDKKQFQRKTIHDLSQKWIPNFMKCETFLPPDISKLNKTYTSFPQEVVKDMQSQFPSVYLRRIQEQIFHPLNI
jgi:hypothetical protein